MKNKEIKVSAKREEMSERRNEKSNSRSEGFSFVAGTRALRGFIAALLLGIFLFLSSLFFSSPSDSASLKLLSTSSKFNDLLIPLGSLVSIGPRPGDPGPDLLPPPLLVVPDPDATAFVLAVGSEEVEVEETEGLDVEVDALRAAENRAAGLLGRMPPPLEGELIAERGEAVWAERARTANSSKGKMREE